MSANKFTHSRHALQEYDNGQPARDAAWNKVHTASAAKVDAVFEQFLKREAAELEVLQEAFYQDTKHINCRDHCKLVGVGDIRRVLML
jgi:hypothetical protein